MSEIPIISQVIHYLLVAALGLFFLLLWWWQIQVLRGKAMKNPDNSVDDWHEQPLCYGFALADATIACPLGIAGAVLTFVQSHWGFLFMALVAFWYLWANVATTATSLRFQKPKMTLMWFIVFPLGAILGLAYLVWILIYLDKVFAYI